MVEIVLPLFEVLRAAGLPAFWAFFAAIVLSLTIWATWRVGRFLRDEVVRPFVEAHLSMLKHSVETTATNTRLHAAQTQLLAGMEETMVAVNRTLASITTTLDTLSCRNGHGQAATPLPRGRDA